jgi:RNase P subunit RPR2
VNHQTKGRAMNGSCRKCGGFLIVERVLDYHSPTDGMKCINCGWYRRDAQPSLGPADGTRNRGVYK